MSAAEGFAELFPLLLRSLSVWLWALNCLGPRTPCAVITQDHLEFEQRRTVTEAGILPCSERSLSSSLESASSVGGAGSP